MAEKGVQATRIVSVLAATVISLACGTNYAYSAWAPEFAEELRLSSTQSNLIGTCGNLGMYMAGVPIGILVDRRGPRPGAVMGAVSLGSGYIGMYKAYNAGAGAITMPWLCIFAFLTGIGGCSAFAGSVKTCALNWPNHRGTATAFPLAAFGLSAFFFATISSIAFPDNTANLLLLLGLSTFSLCIIGVYFLRVVPLQGYLPLLAANGRSGSDSSTLLKHSKNNDSQCSVSVSHEIGTQSQSNIYDGNSGKEPATCPQGVEETSSLLSTSSESGPGDLPDEPRVTSSEGANSSHDLDIRGLAMLHNIKFYYLWIPLGLLTGIGVMTINNIGNDAKALWHHYDDSVPPQFIQERQLMHVEILSLMSFCGRLSSGIGSDLIVRKLGMSRFWCLFISSCIFLAAQISGATIDNPRLLGFVSGLTGLAYGFLFGVYPALVAETFGVNGLSQNWGCMTLAPIAFGYVFNLFYGNIYDRHSIILPDGQRDCREGLNCYMSAYHTTIFASTIGVAISLWTILQDRPNTKHVKERDDARDWDA